MLTRTVVRSALNLAASSYPELSQFGWAPFYVGAVMHTWFQNLNDNGRLWFHFRGSVGKDYRRNWFRYEISSGRALKFEIQHGEACDGDSSTMLILGLFFFTAYITFYLPRTWYFRKKCIATWDGGREFELIDGRRYGFYFYDWAFVWSFHAKVHESSSKDPWWMRQYWHLDEWVLGRWECLEDRLNWAEDIKFKLGTKEFTMNKLEWTRRRRFRRFIPYSLFHRTNYFVEMKIEKPPMRAGKGENSWDIDDDGAFGMSRAWPYPAPGWKAIEMDSACRLAISMYVESLMGDVRKYGAGGGERGVGREDIYTYIGREPVTNGACEA